ncbi:MAG: hypothetical protein CMJ49_00670 [Planctomycetaceae bacterium]|nr:hypothetical protein [Planctomycetaceae bacterium]
MHSLPVIAYHQVIDGVRDVSIVQFEQQMQWLADHEYQSILIRDWIDGKVKLAGREVALTFDDGWLDNWVHAFPILRKYGMSATMFAVTGRQADDQPARPNLEDVWNGRYQTSDLPQMHGMNEAHRIVPAREVTSPCYMNWAELRAMQESGSVDVQSHSHWHRDYWSSPRILDFNTDPRNPIGWATDEDTRVGIPIHPRRSAMRVRRYFPDANLHDQLSELTQRDRLFNDVSPDESRQRLRAAASAFRSKHRTAPRYETADQQQTRIRGEMTASKQAIEAHLNKPCDVICWPWGEHSRLSIQLARQVGYRATVLFSPGPNVRPAAPDILRIRRFPSPLGLDDFTETLQRNASSRAARTARFTRLKRDLTFKVRRRLGLPNPPKPGATRASV